MARVRRNATTSANVSGAKSSRLQSLPRDSALRRVVEKELGAYDDERIYVRRFGRERHPVPVLNCAAKAFTLDVVKRHCGGGEYQIEGRKSGQVVFRRRVRISNP